MVRYFVGVPGSGKTTLAVRLLFKTKNICDFQFSNYENDVSNFLDVQCLSKYKLPAYSYLQVDESGIEFNSRQFKSLAMGIIEHFKLHRHEHIPFIDLFSQTFDDTDKQLRDLATEIWLLNAYGPLTVARKVKKRVCINKETHQLEYQYFYTPIWYQLLPFMEKQFMFCWRPMYYKYFDSYSPIPRDVIPYSYKSSKELHEKVSKELNIKKK